MSIHESTVNYKNLIRDLAEMYPFDISEVVVIELVANSLDAKATSISVDYDVHKGVLTVADNGEGMSAPQFDEYHDFAAGLKTRGSGIGFAGVGAKVSFNIADRVITETRSESFSGASIWYLKSRKRLVWEDTKVSHLHSNGTRVEIHFRPDLKLSYSSTKDIVQLLRRHYLPLFDKTFLDLYAHMRCYHSDLKFVVDGRTIIPSNVVEDLELENVKTFFPTRGRKRIGYGLFGLAELEYPLGPDICGVLLCTHGKVIKADLFNQFPGAFGPRLFGLVEVPFFVDFLTTAKTDFMHARGAKYKQFAGLYDPIRQEFKTWLAELGIQSPESEHTDEATKLERELRKLVEDLPELGEFFGFWARKAVLGQSDSGTITGSMHEGTEATFPRGEGLGKGDQASGDIGDKPGQALIEDQEDGTRKAEPISRTARRGPKISFMSAPERLVLAWVDGNHIVINSGHPSYVRTRSNATARRIYCLFAIGTAVQRFLASADNAEELMFIDRLMSAWGKK